MFSPVIDNPIPSPCSESWKYHDSRIFCPNRTLSRLTYSQCLGHIHNIYLILYNCEIPTSGNRSHPDECILVSGNFRVTGVREPCHLCHPPVLVILPHWHTFHVNTRIIMIIIVKVIHVIKVIIQGEMAGQHNCKIIISILSLSNFPQNCNSYTTQHTSRSKLNFTSSFMTMIAQILWYLLELNVLMYIKTKYLYTMYI